MIGGEAYTNVSPGLCWDRGSELRLPHRSAERIKQMPSQIAQPPANGKPDPRDVAIERADIARRYAQLRLFPQPRKRSGRFDIVRMRIKEVWKIARHRYRHGCLDFDVKELTGEIRAHPQTWTAKATGKFLGLTWEQSCRLGVKK